MSWKTEDDLSPRLAVAQMYRLGLVSQEEPAQVFGISRRSVQRHAAAFDRGGAHGLAAERRGPKGRWKVSPELKVRDFA